VNAFVVVTGIDDNVYFYKASPSAGSPSPAPAPPAPAPAPAPGPQQSSSSGADGGGDSSKCGCGAIEPVRMDWMGLVALAAAGLLLRPAS
jgi:hypothetical protein